LGENITPAPCQSPLAELERFEKVVGARRSTKLPAAHVLFYYYANFNYTDNNRYLAIIVAVGKWT
jgi:hypothetical protein